MDLEYFLDHRYKAKINFCTLACIIILHMCMYMYYACNIMCNNPSSFDEQANEPSESSNQNDGQFESGKGASPASGT